MLKPTLVVLMMVATASAQNRKFDPPARGAEPAIAQPPAVPSMSDLGDVFASAELATVAEGLKFAEGPCFRPDGTLVICDLSGDTIYSINTGDGKKTRKPGEGVDSLRKPSGNAAGAALDKDGFLVNAHFSGKLTRTGADGKETILADALEGKKLNNLNDLVIHSDGSIFFTDFGQGKDAAHTDHFGIYRYAPDGKLSLLTKEVAQPNGIALSPDETKLYVAAYRERVLTVFDLGADGTLSGGKTFADFKDDAIKGSGRPDGVKVDAQGRVFTTGPGGIWVFSPEGKRVAHLPVQGASNIAFGGADGMTLFITAGPRVSSAQLKPPTTPSSPIAPAKSPEKHPGKDSPK